jgi:hypothetical protein
MTNLAPCKNGTFPSDEFGPIGLWDAMMRFHVGGAYAIWLQLKRMEASVSHGPPSEDDAIKRSTLKALILQIIDVLKFDDLDEPVRIAYVLAKSLADNKGWDHIYHDLRHMNNAIDHYLNEKKCFMLPASKEDWYGMAREKFPEDRRLALKGVWTDLDEACDCFSCEHYNATMLLLGRCMEGGVRMVSRKFGVSLTESANPAKDRSWAVLMDSVNKRLKDLESNKRSRSDLRKVERFSAIASHLSACRIAWRNLPAHPGKSSLEVPTKGVLEATVLFVAELAKAV